MTCDKRTFLGSLILLKRMIERLVLESVHKVEWAIRLCLN
jgi:hypothetical protein